MNNKKEGNILPQIKLKYFKKPKEKPRVKGMDCCRCGEKDIVFGCMKNAYSDNPEIYCERCTIKMYEEECNLTFKEAEAYRRRLFDVGYLFSEMVIDDYLKKNGNKKYKDLSESEYDILIQKSKEKYSSISKKVKEEIETYIYQKDIKKELKKYINKK